MTVKIELINMESVGWLREQFKEHIFESYEIRLPDINKDPFRSDGSIMLPIHEREQEYRRCGLQSIMDPQTKNTKEVKGANQS